MNFGSGLKGLQFGLVLAFATLNGSAKGELLGCPVTLAWDSSPDANVTGYALYYGLEPAGVTNRLDVGAEQSVMLTNLYAGSNYFFLVVAYNASGLESVPIGPLYYSPVAMTKIRLNKSPDGSSLLQFRTAANARCGVEYTSLRDPGLWQTLSVTNADAAGNVAITDRSAAQAAKRFYRAVRIETSDPPTLGTLVH